jgi:hypothetical protein
MGEWRQSFTDWTKMRVVYVCLVLVLTVEAHMDVHVLNRRMFGIWQLHLGVLSSIPIMGIYSDFHLLLLLQSVSNP